jgi:ABC-2 type transport system permease protein
MKHFGIFIWKEFLHIWRDKKTLLIIILLPIIEVLLFGFVLTSEINNVSLGIRDQDNTDWSGELIRKFANSPYFEVVRLHDAREVQSVLQSNSVKAILEIKPDAERRILAGETGITTESISLINQKKGYSNSIYLMSVFLAFFMVITFLVKFF